MPESSCGSPMSTAGSGDEKPAAAPTVIDEWFYMGVDEQGAQVQIGPMPWARVSTLADETVVWRKPMAQWEPLSEVKARKAAKVCGVGSGGDHPPCS